MAARGKSNVRPPRESLVLTGCFAALLVLIAISGLRLVEQAHAMRGIYSGLATTQQQQDRLLEEHSRLMLELGALSSMQKVEVVAESELDMHFPDELGEVLE